jgi:hypothetical protein
MKLIGGFNMTFHNQVVIDAAGNATTAVSFRGADNLHHAFAVTVPAGGSPLPPVRLDEGISDVSTWDAPALSVDGAGNVNAVIPGSLNKEDKYPGIWVRRFDRASGTWSKIVKLWSKDKVDVLYWTTAACETGTAFAAFTPYDRDRVGDQDSGNVFVAIYR